MPTSTTRPRGRVDGDRRLDGGAAADAVEHAVEAAEQQLAPAVADQPARAGEAGAERVQLAGRARVVGAQAPRGRGLAGVLGRAHDRGGRRALAQRGDASAGRSCRRRSRRRSRRAAGRRRRRRAARRPAARRTRRPRRGGRRARDAAGSRARRGPRSSRRRRRGSSRSADRPRRCRRPCGGTAPAGPRAHSGQRGSIPRAAQPSAGWSTTRSPRRGPPVISPTTSWPGTNGPEVSDARYSEALPASSAWSEPQMPLRRGRTGSHSGVGQRGGRIVLERERAGVGQARPRREVARQRRRIAQREHQTATRSVAHPRPASRGGAPRAPAGSPG